MIHYVQFKSDISVGGKFGAIPSWQRDKHADVLPLEDRGNFLVLRLQNGQQQRIPISNVISIKEDADEPRRPGKDKL
ncbi:MAG: hypothetical protein ACREJC_09725 [Tepidisphaeraceae bacterium]